MFETSADILNIVKAISILGISILASWAIFYLAMILKELFKIVKEARDIFSNIDELVKSIKEKVEHSTAYLSLMSEGIKKLVEIIGRYTNKKEDKAENKEVE